MDGLDTARSEKVDCPDNIQLDERACEEKARNIKTRIGGAPRPGLQVVGIWITPLSETAGPGPGQAPERYELRRFDFAPKKTLLLNSR